MKKLIKFNSWLWVSLILILSFSILIITFILIYEIEKTIKISFLINEDKKLILLAPEKSLFYLEKNKEVSIKYADHIYTLKIGGISHFNKTVFITFQKMPSDIKLIANTQIEGVLFYDKFKIINSIFGTNF